MSRLLNSARRVKRSILDRLSGQGRDEQPSYSQEGEDRVLWRFLGPDVPREGYYVDVGAYHPTRFSNTYLLYRRGWRGVNIDARPGIAAEFLKIRPRDTVVESGVSDVAGELDYYMFNEPALNGFDRRLSSERNGTFAFRIVRQIRVPTRPLREILARHVADGQKIDFMTIDVEGFDAAVVRSNDWNRFRPRWVAIEVEGKSLETALACESVSLLRNTGYTPRARTVSTMFLSDGR